VKPGSTITVTELARNLRHYINRVALRGDRFTLLRGGEAVAELTPVPKGVRLGDLPDILKNLPHLTPEEALSFEEDLEAIRAELNRAVPRDPWEP
jgi:antitoxin (DNA-binding transcriptional repressor) of toxin-antitoxin stability system